MPTYFQYPTRGQVPAGAFQQPDRSFAQLLAFDRMMQRLLGFADVQQQRKQEQERYKTDLGFRQRAEEAQRQQQEWQRQQGQAQLAMTAGANVARQPELESVYRTIPGLEMMNQGQYRKPALGEIVGEAQLGGLSPLAQVARQAETERQRVRRTKATEFFSDLTPKDMTDFQTKSQVLNQMVQAGMLDADAANQTIGGWHEALQAKEAAAKKTKEDELAARMRLAWAQNAPTPQRYQENDMLQAAYRGDLDAWNRYRKGRGLPTVNPKTPQGERLWATAQETAKSLLLEKTAKGEIAAQKVETGEQERDARDFYALRDNPQELQAEATRRGYGLRQALQLVDDEDRRRTAKQKPTPEQRVQESRVKIQETLIANLKQERVKATGTKQKREIGIQIAAEERRLADIIRSLSPQERDEALKDPKIAGGLKGRIRKAAVTPRQPEDIPLGGEPAGPSKTWISPESLTMSSLEVLAMIAEDDRYSDETRRMARGLIVDRQRSYQRQAPPVGPITLER